MSKQHIGEIPLEDYLEVVGKGAPRRPHRAWRAVGLLALCTLCTAAGDYIGPWTGKNAKSLTFDQAIELLNDPANEEWASELGMHAAHRHAERAIDAMHGLALRQEDHQTYASSYLRNLCAKGIGMLQQLEAEGVVPEKVRKDLQHIRRQLDK